MLTVFEMTVGEEWSHTMWWYSRYASLGHGYPVPAIQLLFIGMYLWMNCLLFSLYIAMLLDNFSIPGVDRMLRPFSVALSVRTPTNETSWLLYQRRGRKGPHPKTCVRPQAS